MKWDRKSGGGGGGGGNDLFFSHTERRGRNWHKIVPKISQGCINRGAEIEAKKGIKGAGKKRV